MDIEEEVEIERAHRLGKGQVMVVKFLSFKQRSLVLKNANKLKHSDIYRNIYVREDFSVCVRDKRNKLKEKARELFECGRRPIFRFDKLISDEGVFVYDTEAMDIVKVRGGSVGRKGESVEYGEWRMRERGEESEREVGGAVGGVDIGHAESSVLPFDWMRTDREMTKGENSGRKSGGVFGSDEESPDQRFKPQRTDSASRLSGRVQTRAMSSSSTQDRLQTNTLNTWVSRGQTQTSGQKEMQGREGGYERSRGGTTRAGQTGPSEGQRRMSGSGHGGKTGYGQTHSSEGDHRAQGRKTGGRGGGVNDAGKRPGPGRGNFHK